MSKCSSKKRKSKNKFKISLWKKIKKKLKGFTLVELLAVIVILAIIMIIAIPSVLSTLDTARRSSFAEYVNKVYLKAQEKYVEDNMIDSTTYNTCVMYSVDDLGFESHGSYDGYILIDLNKDYIITLHDDNYMITGFNYSKNGNKIDDSIEKYDSTSSKLSVEYLCSVSNCDSCNYNGKITSGSKVTLLTGEEINNVWKQLVSGNDAADYTYFDKNATGIKIASKLTSSYTTKNIDSTGLVSTWFDTSDNTIYIYAPEGTTMYLNSNSDHLFCAFGSISTIDLNMFNWSKVNSLRETFAGWGYDTTTGYTKLDFSKCDLSNVNYLAQTFRYAKVLKEINFGKNTLSKNTSFAQTFQFCHSLTKLDVSKFKTSNVTYMGQMFEYVPVSSLDVSGWDTSKVTNMGLLFSFMDNIKTLDLTNFDTSNVTNVYGMFYADGNLEHIYVGKKWNLSKVTNTLDENGCLTGGLVFQADTKLPNFTSSDESYQKAYVGAGGYLETK